MKIFAALELPLPSLPFSMEGHFKLATFVNSLLYPQIFPDIITPRRSITVENCDELSHATSELVPTLSREQEPFNHCVPSSVAACTVSRTTPPKEADRSKIFRNTASFDSSHQLPCEDIPEVEEVDGVAIMNEANGERKRYRISISPSADSGIESRSESCTDVAQDIRALHISHTSNYKYASKIPVAITSMGNFNALRTPFHDEWLQTFDMVTPPCKAVLPPRATVDLVGNSSAYFKKPDIIRSMNQRKRSKWRHEQSIKKHIERIRGTTDNTNSYSCSSIRSASISRTIGASRCSHV